MPALKSGKGIRSDVLVGEMDNVDNNSPQLRVTNRTRSISCDPAPLVAEDMTITFPRVSLMVLPDSNKKTADTPEKVTAGTGALRKSCCKPSALQVRHAERTRKNALITATSSSISGRRAAVWVDQWDHGSRATRLLILEAFLALHSSSNTNRIEKDLGDFSLFFFTRITAWLRLTCKLNQPLRLLIAAISLFVRGVRYLTCLVEVGGAQTLIDTLATCSLSIDDRREIVLLLLYMANAGRVYREMLCDDENDVCLLLKGLKCESEGDILDILAALFLILGDGSNSRVSSRVQSGLIEMIPEEDTTIGAALQAARILRIFQSSRDKMYADKITRDALEDTGTVPLVGVGSNVSPESARALLDALFALLSHEDLRLRVEGTELLTLVGKNIQLTGPILNHCFDVVDDDCLAIEAEDNLIAAMTLRRHQISFGSTAVNIMLLDTPCEARQRLTLDIIARRSAHFTLLKYLRLLESGYASSILDCCRALQFVCRGALAQERHVAEGGVPLEKAANYIREAVGETLYSVLLYEDLTENEAMSIARSVTSSEMRM